MSVVNVAGENGVLVFRDVNGDVIDVITAGPKFIMRPECNYPVDGTVNAMTSPIALQSQWSHIPVNSGTFSPPTTAAGATAYAGQMVMTTGSTDTDDTEAASSWCFYADKGLILEAAVALDDVDKSAFCLGFSSLQASGAADTILCNVNNSTVTTNAGDGAFVFCDSSAAVNTWRFGTVNNDTDSTIINSLVAPVDGTIYRVKLEINQERQCSAWLNGILLGTANQLIRGSATPIALCAYVGFMNKGEDAANTARLAKFAAWQWNP